MKPVEVGRIIARLDATLHGSGFTDSEKGIYAQEEWYYQLETLDFDIANKAVDVIVETYKFFPKISEFRELYVQHKLIKEAAQKHEHCYICDGLGGIVHNKNPERPQMFSACTCILGQKQMYDGKTLKIRPSNNYIDNITKWFSPEELQDIEGYNVLRNRNPVPPPAELAQKIKMFARC